MLLCLKTNGADPVPGCAYVFQEPRIFFLEAFQVHHIALSNVPRINLLLDDPKSENDLIRRRFYRKRVHATPDPELLLKLFNLVNRPICNCHLIHDPVAVVIELERITFFRINGLTPEDLVELRVVHMPVFRRDIEMEPECFHLLCRNRELTYFVNHLVRSFRKNRVRSICECAGKCWS